MTVVAENPTRLEAKKTTRVPVDVMILTYNEEANLSHALQSVMGWSSRVFVVDSGSRDGTERIAREMGAEFVPHAWEGYARQKNWALDHLPFESPWVLILDADEAITPTLRDEIVSLCSRPVDSVPENGFFINRYLVFMGKRIRHCGYFPSWNLRLFKRGTAKYEDRPVHEHMVLQGKEGFLKGLLEHEDRRGLECYIAKHNRYSTLEAELMFYGQGHTEEVKAKAFGNAIERRRFFKNVVYPRLPARWFSRFIWMYFINLGILDGLTGLRFCLLISTHELFTTLKLRELQRLEKTGARRPTTPAVVAEPSSVVTTNSNHAHLGSLEAHQERGIEARSRSPWTFRQNVGRVLWMIVYSTLFRPSFHNWYGWRRMLLRLFGAQVGNGVRVRPTVRIELPWNLELGDHSGFGDYSILYSLGKIRVGRYATVSQYAHLCAGTHDYTRRSFPLLVPPIVIGDEAWVAADAFVGPGVTVGARSVVGARATVTKDVPPDEVVAGNPARFLKPRILND